MGVSVRSWTHSHKVKTDVFAVGVDVRSGIAHVTACTDLFDAVELIGPLQDQFPALFSAALGTRV